MALQFVDIAGKGRGIITDVPILRDAVIEKCPILPISFADAVHIEKTILDSYIYCWGAEWCVAWGYGSLYNHHDDPNAIVREDHKNNLLVCSALRDIAAGEEITHNYSENGRAIVFKDGHWFYADTMDRIPRTPNVPENVERITWLHIHPHQSDERLRGFRG